MHAHRGGRSHSSAVRAGVVTLLGLLGYVVSAWPDGRPPRSVHVFMKGLPVLLTASIGAINAWWPDATTREFHDQIEELRQDLRTKTENRATHYGGSALGARNAPPAVPPL
jgi:hypothetical protein